ncbi:hypothetical protein HD596_010431 [Nonomuraea jabiensis]|uniref:Uncharacterized protein n=1 Tax=Nonomuraea jabiensis TaxID=882448 RepID=A0A7W9GH25_9ACTN|nr:hypothetical protein [Nonomuraea jabiensis]
MDVALRARQAWSNPSGYQPDAPLLIVNSDDFGMHRAINDAVARSIDERIPGSILWPRMR